MRLAESGVLRQIGGGSYDRTYAADELFTLVEVHERLAAHPDDDGARILILAEDPGLKGVRLPGRDRETD